MDDRFLLALFGAFLHGTRSTGLDWVEVLRSGIISIAIIALASRDDRKRALGSGLLATAFKQISVSTAISDENSRPLTNLSILHRQFHSMNKQHS